MGDVSEQDMAEATQAIADTMKDMGVTGLGQMDAAD
jgi:hypothetical protein